MFGLQEAIELQGFNYMLDFHAMSPTEIQTFGNNSFQSKLVVLSLHAMSM